MSILDELQQEAKEQNKPLEQSVKLNILDCIFDADIAQTSLLAQELRKQIICNTL